MQEWLAIRRKGQDFSQTMMGEICRGSRLDKPEDQPGDLVVEEEDEAAPDKEGDDEIE